MLSKVIATAAAGVALILSGSFLTSSHTVTRTHVERVSAAEPIYIRNLAPHDISDAAIRADIPAWEQAVNVDFAHYWHTTHYKLVFIGRKRAPTGAISAIFLQKGPVKGALAYHTMHGNAPAIVIYAGTGNYYGYSNSVSFTHELFELAADPVTSYLNVGYPDGYYWLEQKDTSLKMATDGAVGWFSEVCDPVEADSYFIGNVKISDFVTPAWFNDGIGQKFDFMGLTQQPFWIRPGGYAQFLDQLGWEVVKNFRAGVASDAGFLKGEQERGVR